MIKCELCGQETVIRVAENGGVGFFSCCNEDCIDHAELLVETNGGLQSVDEMLNAYYQIVEEITSEKDKVR